MSELFQLKTSVNEEFRGRLREAEAAGRITNKSGLHKVALSHAMMHGQAATEELLRNGKAPTGTPAGQEVAELLEQILAQLITFEHQAAERAADVKRCVVQCTAMLAGLLVMVGLVLYLRPVRTA